MREVDVRRSLRDHLDNEHRGDADTLIIDELGIGHGRRRVDVAVVNGELAGFEIKSAADTLVRLPGQMDLYNRVFDRMWLVASPRHLKEAFGTIPIWWGVLSACAAEDGVRLARTRPSRLNESDQDALTVAQLLWRDEAVELLDEFQIGDGKLRRGARRHMYAALAAELPVTILKARVRSRLKARTQWR